MEDGEDNRAKAHLSIYLNIISIYLIIIYLFYPRYLVTRKMRRMERIVELRNIQCLSNIYLLYKFTIFICVVFVLGTGEQGKAINKNNIIYWSREWNFFLRVILGELILTKIVGVLFVLQPKEHKFCILIFWLNICLNNSLLIDWIWKKHWQCYSKS